MIENPGSHPQMQPGQDEALFLQKKKTRTILWIGASLGVLVILSAVIGFHNRQGGTPRLNLVSQSQIAALSGTLSPDQAPALLDAAKTCKVPLAEFKMWHGPGVQDSVVRVQSGSYVSPPFKVTTTPEMIAIPFPAPYAAGAGTMTILGTSGALNVTLSPGIYADELRDALPINLVWDTGNPCP